MTAPTAHPEGSPYRPRSGQGRARRLTEPPARDALKDPLNIPLHGILAVFALLWLVPYASHAQSKSGVSSQSISLPTGPGSISGMGESFDVQLNTGTFSFSVPILVPPGVAGHQPSLSLAYNPGIPNGPFGQGWAISAPAFTRKADDGMPTYTAADTFTDGSGEDLILMTDGTYRREFELDGQFARVTRAGAGWLQESKSGTKILFGQYPNGSDSSRVSRIWRDANSFDETLAWYADEIIDINGNKVSYHYTTFPDSPGVLYLSEVRYSEFGTNAHRAIFEYVTRTDREDIAASQGGLAMYSAGFPQIYGRKCKAVRIYTQGRRVRTYTFGYQLDPDEAPVPSPSGAIETRVCRIQKVTQWDEREVSHLPPLTFSYSPYTAGLAEIVTVSNAPPWSITPGAHNGVDLFDANSDGLPDLMDGSLPNNWRYTRNLGGGRWDTPQAMSNSPSVTLGDPSVQVVDFNSDGLADFAVKAGTTPLDDYKYQLYEGNDRWGEEREFSSNPPFAYNDPDIALLDLDFDKDIDVLYFHTSGQIAYYQQDGNWTDTALSWFSGQLGDIPHYLRLSQANVKLADLNGDRMLDLVELNPLSTQLEVRYWPSMGRGRFGTGKFMADMPYPFADLDGLQFLDINGDGLTDLVKLPSFSQVIVWLNMGDGTWSDPLYVNRPSYDPTRTAIRGADMNGNGSGDLLFCDSVLSEYQYLDFVGAGQVPNQLVAIDNGMGKRTYIHHASVAEYMLEAEDAGHPWTLFSPIAMQVVSGYDIQIGQDLDGHPGPDKYVTRIRYRDPFYDSQQKEFRGFAFVEKIENGDEFYGVTNGAAPGVVNRIAYHPGAPDGIDNDGNGQTDEMHGENYEEHALKGMILWTEVTDVGVNGTEEWPYDASDFLPDSLVYGRTLYEMEVRTSHGTNDALLPLMPVDLSREVRYPAVTRTIHQIVEKGAGPKKLVEVRKDYDAYGNCNRTEEWGDISPGSTLDDERFTVTTYNYNTSNWVLDRPSRILITDEASNWVKETHFQYDALGRLTHNMAYLDPVTPVTTATIEYDAYGNATCRKDARGFCISNVFDSVFHTFPIEEYIQVGFGSPDLISYADYDFGYGHPTRIIDYNGHESRMLYDSFGRLVGIVAPGDTDALPGKRFKYVICDDLRGWCYDYDSDGDLTLTTGHPFGSIASRIYSYQRENFGRPGEIEAVTYSDGMGRKLSTQVEDVGGFTVTESALYNTRGVNRFNFLPHPATGSFLANTSAPSSELVFDAMGRVVKTILPPDPNNIRHFSRTEYFPLKRVTYDFEDTVAGGPHENTPTTTEMDGLGRQTRLIEVNAQGAAVGDYITTYFYNLQDNLVRIVDAQGNVKTNAFDGWGRKIATHDPNAGLFRYVYDSVGNLLETIDAKGQRNTYTYDGANRSLAEDYGGDGTNDVVYGYDSPSSDYPDFQSVKGRLARIDDQSGACFFNYNERGNLVEKIKRIRRRDGTLEDYRFASLYDAADRMIEAIFPDADRLSYEYNERGLLRSIPGIVTSIVYNAAGQRTAMAHANGVVSTYTYDQRQRLRQLVSASASPLVGTIQHLTYDLDGANNMLAMTDGRGLAPSDPRNMTQAFVLDDIYRLTQVVGTGYGTINHTYDKLGNMTSMTSPDISDPRVNHGMRSFSGGASGRIGRNPGDAPGPHALTGTDSGYAVTYDDNGNMVTARGNAYEWDSLDRLQSVANTNGTLRFVYDYAGSRVLKYLEGDPTNEVAYLSQSYELRHDQAVKFIFAGPVRVARVEGPLPRPVRMTQREVLRPGWNHVGIKVVLSNGAPDTALSSLAGHYSAVYQNDGEGYREYRPGETDNTLTNLNAGWAYWIYASEACTLELSGERYRPPTQPLVAGWQGISLSADSPQNLTELVQSNAHLLAVWKLDNLLNKYIYHDSASPPSLQTLDQAGPGDALLVLSSAAQPLTPKLPQRRAFFFHEDHLGSGNLVTDEASLVVEELYYYPFGLQRHRHTPNGDIYASEYTFSGKELDPESQISYFGARYYDPVLCVFISVDPVAMHSPGRTMANSQRMNVYAYAGGNPLVLVDPDGQFFFAILAAVAIEVFALEGIAAVAVTIAGTTLDDFFASDDKSVGQFMKSLGIGIANFIVSDTLNKIADKQLVKYTGSVEAAKEISDLVPPSIKRGANAFMTSAITLGVTKPQSNRTWSEYFESALKSGFAAAGSQMFQEAVGKPILSLLSGGGWSSFRQDFGKIQGSTFKWVISGELRADVEVNVQHDVTITKKISDANKTVDIDIASGAKIDAKVHGGEFNVNLLGQELYRNSLEELSGGGFTKDIPARNVYKVHGDFSVPDKPKISGGWVK